MHILPAVLPAALLLHTVAALDVSLSPAATTVHASGLLPEEHLQLTDEVLQSVAAASAQHYGSASTLADAFSFYNTSDNNESSAGNATAPRCKTYAGDPRWPDDELWSAFDGLLGGALLEVAPIASPCYTNWDDYDADSCRAISDNFADSNLHAGHPSSIMSPFYQGATCMPLEGALANCTIGGYPYYVVNATNVAQIQLAVNFARNLNLRLVIKNTGHDFAGKSAGGGALSIWTHHFKSVSYLPNYNGSTYSGKAFKVGSGVQATDLYEAARDRGVTVVGGEGQTVGLSGGYIQGGGHSPLSSIYGLGADSALEFDVVTADGRFVTASDSVNPDLFWALRGGGGSTFGVVTAVTVKAWPRIGVATTSFNLTTSDADAFWAAVRSYWAQIPAFADAGAYGYFRIWPLGGGAWYFGLTPFFAPNRTAAEAAALLRPFTDDLARLGLGPAPPAPVHHDDFHAAWRAAFPLEGVGGAEGRVGSRLFPRDGWAGDAAVDRTLAAVRATAEAGYYFTGFGMKNELHPANTANSANTAWRRSLVHGMSSFQWSGQHATAEDVKEMWTAFNDTSMAVLRAVTPGSGAYLGEADILEPNFQQAFWGTNYDRLLSIKKQLDPSHLFYATTGVGSESWVVETADGLPTQNGRLCRVE